MGDRSDIVYLRHIRDCCLQIGECASLRNSAVPLQILFAAVCRNLEILGEASRKVAPDFRTRHPSIPWREMNDLRNVLIHNYDGIDPHLVWEVVDQKIPGVLRAVLELLAQRTASTD